MTSRVYVDLEAERQASLKRHGLRELGVMPKLERCYFEARYVARSHSNRAATRGWNVTGRTK